MFLNEKGGLGVLDGVHDYTKNNKYEESLDGSPRASYLNDILEEGGVFGFISSVVGVQGDLDILAPMLAQGRLALPVVSLLGQVEPLSSRHHGNGLGIGDKDLEVDLGETGLSVEDDGGVEVAAVLPLGVLLGEGVGSLEGLLHVNQVVEDVGQRFAIVGSLKGEDLELVEAALREGDDEAEHAILCLCEDELGVLFVVLRADQVGGHLHWFG